MNDSEVLRYSAFTTTPDGGNPAGIVLDADALDAAAMLRVAAEVGYSETAFLSAAPAGTVAATLTSVPPQVLAATDADTDRALAALGWGRGDLDPALPPRVAFAGAHHLVLAAATRDRLARLDYDMAALGDLMAARGWTTLQLVHREGPHEFAVRDPFPPGGVYEDPATGAAAAAFGGYLAAVGAVDVPARLTLRQGHDMGRPSTLLVDVSADPSRGVDVTGSAVALPGP